jgi:hypothetical protein
MSDQDIQRVMNFTFCSEEEAKKALSETNDVVDACDLLMQIPQTKGAPKPKVLSEEQQRFTKIRKDMEAIDNSIMKSSQPDSSSQESLRNRALVQEETKLHSDYIQKSHLPTLEEEEQKQETVCQ